MSEGSGTTVAQWHEMSAGGPGGLSRELLDGEPVTRSPMTTRHADAAVLLHGLLDAAIADEALTQLHQPVVLDAWSEPRPDISVVERAGQADSKSTILLVVEIADSNHGLIYTRGRKASYYARSGIPECWIVDLLSEQVLVHTDPASGGYRSIRNLRSGAQVALAALPGVRLDVASILGP
jgi:Uma2 family endonuclease